MSTSLRSSVTTRSGRSYELTAPMSAADRMRRRWAGTSADELDVERQENTASRRVACARRTSTERVAERSDNTTRRRAARVQRTSRDRAAEQSDDTTRRRAARTRRSPQTELLSEVTTPPGGGQLALEGCPRTELLSRVKTLLAGGQFKNHQKYELPPKLLVVLTMTHRFFLVLISIIYTIPSCRWSAFLWNIIILFR